MGFSFSQPIELRMAELISGTRSDVAITIYGDDLATLERLSFRCKASSAGSRARPTCAASSSPGCRRSR
jgi:cobalt-zinc-cadmium resistance protein CzcA